MQTTKGAGNRAFTRPLVVPFGPNAYPKNLTLLRPSRKRFQPLLSLGS